MPQKWGFSPISDPQDFFQKSGSVTFVPLWCPNFMQKIRKNQWTVSEIFKDGPQTDQRTRAITKDPSGKPGVQNNCSYATILISTDKTHSNLTMNLQKVDDVTLNDLEQSKFRALMKFYEN